MNALIVDDQFPLALMYMEYMKEKNIESTYAKNGKVAADMLQNYRPDFILSDIQMPVMDGFRLYNIASGQYNIPTFLFTASSEIDIYQRRNPTIIIFSKSMYEDEINETIDNIVNKINI